MIFKDYYAILEIPSSVSESDLKKGFRKQAIKWHPDRNPNKDTTTLMQDINEAYLILGDKEARQLYDVEYEKFRVYQRSQAIQPAKNEHASSQTDSTSDFQQQDNSNYEVQDSILLKWILNAKLQAVDLAKQTVKDFKGVTKAAAIGCFDGIIQVIIWIVLVNIVVFTYRSCN